MTAKKNLFGVRAELPVKSTAIVCQGSVTESATAFKGAGRLSGLCRIQESHSLTCVSSPESFWEKKNIDLTIPFIFCVPTCPSCDFLKMLFLRGWGTKIRLLNIRRPFSLTHSSIRTGQRYDGNFFFENPSEKHFLISEIYLSSSLTAAISSSFTG